MECDDRARLQQKYSETAAAFDRARAALHEKIGVLSKEQYDTLRAAVDRAWEAVQEARAALDRHLREHDCGGGN